MKDYEDADEHVKEWLEDIVAEDEYGLKPESLYNNILHSSGDEKILAEIFAVPVGLIRVIKESQRRVVRLFFFKSEVGGVGV